MNRTEIIKAILLKEKRNIERYNYLTSLTDNQLKAEAQKLNVL